MSLLSPQDRSTLIECLRPPADHQLHTAVGTTYSLDLLAMMVAPIGFTLFELDGEGLLAEQTPMELLEALRRHAEHIVLFCEAGRIALPNRHHQLFAFLEKRIVEVKAPTANRSFHPKLWVMRFTGPDDSVRYRMLCMSRNLTFDRSMDSILSLEGPLLTGRTRGIGVNAPLRQFMGTLSNMGVRKIDDTVAAQVKLVESEIARVDWDLGELPFDEYRFIPLGHLGRQKPPAFDDCRRLLIASPFVSDSTLKSLAPECDSNILISRKVELDGLREPTRALFQQIHTVRPQPEVGETELEDIAADQRVAAGDLHAKLYIADGGWNSTVWTGSANATRAAFDGNVEFMVELIGKKSTVGIDAFLAPGNSGVGMPDLLEPYIALEAAPDDSRLESLQEELDNLRREIARANWSVNVEHGGTDGTYRLSISSGGPLPVWANHIAVRCGPVSLPAAGAKLISSGDHGSLRFETVSPEAVTSFLAFDIEGILAEGRRHARFVINAELIGEPADRRDRIMRTMLRDRRSVIRFLLLLLSEAGDEFSGGIGARWGSSRGGTVSAGESEALLEPLLRTFDRDPERLSSVTDLVRELEATDDGRLLVPEGLGALLAVIQAARGSAES